MSLNTGLDMETLKEQLAANGISFNVINAGKVEICNQSKEVYNKLLISEEFKSIYNNHSFVHSGISGKGGTSLFIESRI